MYKTHLRHIDAQNKRLFDRVGYYKTITLCGQSGDQDVSRDSKEVDCKKCLTKMKDCILFCEDRNAFYETTRNGMTIWSRENKKACKFNTDGSLDKLFELKNTIIDHKYIKIVGLTFERYS